MFSEKSKVTDDKKNYIIYYPYPCYQFPKYTPETGYQTTSIDPGIKNFAIRIEKWYDNQSPQMIHFEKIDFRKYGLTNQHMSEIGTTGLNPQILSAATEFLTKILDLIKQSNIIIIERQLAVNYKSSRLFQHIITFLCLYAPMFPVDCVIADVNPKLKGKQLKAPPNINKPGLKKWSVEKACQILQDRNDIPSLRIMTLSKKKDDLSDTVIQMEAFMSLITLKYVSS